MVLYYGNPKNLIEFHLYEGLQQAKHLQWEEKKKLLTLAGSGDRDQLEGT